MVNRKCHSNLFLQEFWPKKTPQKQHPSEFAAPLQKIKKNFAKGLEASVSKRLFRGVLGGCLPREESQLSNGNKTLTPWDPCMVRIFTHIYICSMFVVSVGSYTIHGSFDIPLYWLFNRDLYNGL